MGEVKTTVYDTINDIEELDNSDNLVPVSEMSIEDILGSDIGTFLSIREQIEKEKARQKEIKLAIRTKQIDIRKNEIFNAEITLLSNLRSETNRLEEELQNYDDVEKISDKEYVKN